MSLQCDGRQRAGPGAVGPEGEKLSPPSRHISRFLSPLFLTHS